MKEAAKSMEFERAALLRDQIYELRATLADTSTPDASLPSTNGPDVARATPSTALANEAAAARATRAARSPLRYGGGRRRR
jgi:hypothetical protein